MAFKENLSLSSLNQDILTCRACPRLRKHCEAMAQIKRRAYRDESYWGKPITGFGDPKARVAIIGLAPAAHGANRTGRIFTGDRSGDWLFRGLHKAGFANQPESIHREDSLQLSDVYITCVVKCAPPDNKPNPKEEKRCSRYLAQEIQILENVQIWIALGQIAFKGIWPFLQPPGASRPAFKHGGEINLERKRSLLLSYHPSQQNTFTGRLTEPMFDQIFTQARSLLA